MNTAAHAYRACLPDLADALAARLTTLRDDPTPDRCEWVIKSLGEAQEVIGRLRVELTREPTQPV